MSRVKNPAPPRLPIDRVPRMGSTTPPAPKAERAAPRVETPRPAPAAPPAAPTAGPRLQDRPGRLKLLLVRRRPLLRPLAMLALLAMIGIGIAGAVQSLGRNPGQVAGLDHIAARMGMTVETITIEGRQKTPERAIRAALGIREGDAILAVPLAEARARIEAINWVQSATVERRLPGRIVVRITERSPFAVWQNEGRFVLIDRKGDVVSDSNVAAFAGQLPVVVGPGAPAAAEAIIEALAAHPVLVPRVVAFVRVGERRWNLRMTNGADVMLPEGREVQGLARLAELHASHALLDRPLAVVDLRLPDKLVVRPAPPPGTAPAPPPSARKT